MELPHLKLYLRRLMASPQGLPLGEALRTPRVRALTAILGWTIAATLTLFAIGYGYTGNDSLSHWLNRDGRQWLIAACTLVGVFYLLFLPAEQMLQLTRQGKSDTPDWYTSLLSSLSAVLSSLLAALFAALPAALGLALYIGFTQEFYDDGSYSAVYGLTLRDFTLLVIRLPAFALFLACLCLALRQHRWAPYVPALSALAGTVLTQWALSYQVQLTQLNSILPGAYFMAMLSGTCLVLAGAGALRWLATGQRGAGALASATLIVAITFPLVAGIGLSYEEYGIQSSARLNFLSLAHQATQHAPPYLKTDSEYHSFSSFWYQVTSSEGGFAPLLAPGHFALQLTYPTVFSRGEDLPEGSVAPVFIGIGGGLFWLWFALDCLNVARGLGRRRSSRTLSAVSARATN